MSTGVVVTATVWAFGLDVVAGCGDSFGCGVQSVFLAGSRFDGMACGLSVVGYVLYEMVCDRRDLCVGS